MEKPKRLASDTELLGLRIDKNGSALWAIPSAEKRLSASMKNRIEASKLAVQKKILDRHAFRSIFLIEKEKKHAVAVLQKVMDTSGISGEGIPPGREDGELLNELAPHFKNGLHLSDKRLSKWKEAEQQIDVMLAATGHPVPLNNPLISEGRKQVEKYAVQKLLSHLLDSYGDENEMIHLISSKDEQGMRQTKTYCVRDAFKNEQRSVDVFSGLRQRTSEHNECDEKTFSVAQWQKQVQQNYIKSVTEMKASIPSSKRGRSTAVTQNFHSERLGRRKSGPVRKTKFNIPKTRRLPRESNENIKKTISKQDVDDRDEKESILSFACKSEQSPGNSKVAFQQVEDSKLSNGSKNCETGEKKNVNFSRLPHWKKDLLKEAPMGLNLKREQVRVNVVMSKAKRVQELDRLVAKHVYHPKAIARREHERREYNKLHLYTTLLLLHEKIKE